MFKKWWNTWLIINNESAIFNLLFSLFFMFFFFFNKKLKMELKLVLFYCVSKATERGHP